MERVNKVEDVVQEGDPLKVKVIGIEAGGKLRLSRKAVLMEEAGMEFSLEDNKRPSSDNRRRPQGGGNNRRR
jgi:polyribonucleotide nucleotidyltransferase